MREYEPKELEPKWQREWAEARLYEAKGKGNKWYSLMEFPYPSGDGLHAGHVRGFTAMDIVSRKRRMQGYDVLYPIGWDAFGLPTENYALKTGRQPAEITRENTANFRRQFERLGISFDWSREINTTDPKYYKWTQWIFLKFLEKGLAYKAKIPVNWCPKDKIVLANEEVVDGKCERCGTEVEERLREQWMLKITAYAERLLEDLDKVDYPERVKAQQKNWIGKSEGAEIEFKAVGSKQEAVRVFTTRPDTIYGATFIVKAGKVDRFTGEYVTNPATKEPIPVWEAEYVLGDYGTGAIMGVPAHDERDLEFARKHDLPIRYVVAPRMVDWNNPHVPGKKIVFRNAVIAILRNPKTGKIVNLKWKKQPWTTFVMGGVEEGEDVVEAARREIVEETGYKNIKFVKVLGGPVQSEFFAAHKDVNRVAHTSEVLFELLDEERDELSAEEAAIHEVIWVSPEDIEPSKMTHVESPLVLERLLEGERAYTGEGVLINSGKFDRLPTEEGRKKITKHIGGEWVTKYKLRDWVFSRQRYWGEPIPVIHCEKCGLVPVPDEDLPVELPKVERYEPTENGDSPLANISEWVNVECPKCGGKAKRETDVMPNWAGSSWYFFRYTDPQNSEEFASKKALKHWMPVDWYNGGMEHTVLHLLYSRFWNKFLYDLKLVPTDEPYKKRTSHGIILAADGRKMSKSFGNVVNPDEIVERFGADTLRLYEMFMGPFEQAIAWNSDSLVGPRRFLERVWKLQGKLSETAKSIHLDQLIKKVSDDIEGLRFNTAVSSLMISANELAKQDQVSKKDFETLLKLLAPLAPHITEELWRQIGHKDSIHLQAWPEYDPKLVRGNEATIVVQINGKVRAKFLAPLDTDEETLKSQARSIPEVGKWLEGKKLKKVIIVPGKVVNFVEA